MSQPRFFHSPLPASGCVDLDSAEARHASNVLRLPVGASVLLFDGQGGEAQAVITLLGKRHVQVEITRRTDANRELPLPLELLVALPKGDRQKTLIDGLVQYGTTRLTPLVCARGVAQPSGGALERLHRSVLESSKQCGRNRLLHIADPKGISELAEQTASIAEYPLSLVAHPYGSSQTLRQAFADAGAAHCGQGARVAIGPEGGFTEAEIQLLTGAGWKQIALGPRLLRIEYAALQIAAWWATLMDSDSQASLSTGGVG